MTYYLLASVNSLMTGGLTTEKLVWHPQSRKLTTHVPSTYKIPTADDCQPVLNVRLFQGPTTGNPGLRVTRVVQRHQETG